MTADDIKMCNCYGCNKEMLGVGQREVWEHLHRRTTYLSRKGLTDTAPPPTVAGRVEDHPYCSGCYKAALIRAGYRSPANDDTVTDL